MPSACGGSRPGHASRRQAVACPPFSMLHRPLHTSSLARLSNRAPSPSRKKNTPPPSAHPQTIILMKHLPLAFLILFAASHFPITASAIQPSGTTMTGTVTSVDHSTRSITFEQSDGKQIRHFVYAHQARFWHRAPDASPAALRAGMHVQIDLHQPIFGPDFVRHIVLIVSAPSAMDQGNK